MYYSLYKNTEFLNLLKTPQRNLMKLFKEGEEEMTENDGGDNLRYMVSHM
jgi:hypothetical protein